MTPAHWIGDPWGFFGFLIGLAFLALIVIALIALLRSAGDGSGAGRGSPALRMVEESYARGEISRDEFLERRRVLTGRPPADGP